MDSAANSVESTPRAADQPPAAAAGTPRVRLMCSFGGRILPRPHDNLLRYVGGDTRIVAVHRSIAFSALHAKLAKLITGGAGDATIKYQLPSEDLDSLISVSNDEDVDNMMEEYDRLIPAAGQTPRLRLFLFPPAGDEGALISKRESWFLDALNGGAGEGRLERGRSEASSIVSEVPDYLFGLDNTSDEPKPKSRVANENASDPGSPFPGTTSPMYWSVSSASASAAPPVQPIPDVPVEPPVYQQGGYAGNPVWQYVQEQVPVYYMPGPVGAGGFPLPPVPVQYFNQPPTVTGGQIPAGYGQQMQGGGHIPAGYGPPMQGVWGNPGHGGPVYVGGPPRVGRPTMAGDYDYAAVADASEKLGMMRNPAAGAVPMMYAVAGVPPASGEPAMAAGPEGRVGRTSGEYLKN